MQRTIVQRADISGDALADLKKWLGITRPNEDALLVELIGASLALCEAFTGQSPLQQTVEERLATDRGCNILSSQPVRAFVSAELISQDGTRNPLVNDAFSFLIEAETTAAFEVKAALEGQAIAVRVIAGISADWSSLPSALKQGVIRMAAHHYRDRDFDSDASRSAPPPASVTALWRPWRTPRLA